jgi:hypothetical protein
MILLLELDGHEVFGASKGLIPLAENHASLRNRRDPAGGRRCFYTRFMSTTLSATSTHKQSKSMIYEEKLSISSVWETATQSAEFHG